MTIDTKQLRELEAKATPGDWNYGCDGPSLPIITGKAGFVAFIRTDDEDAQFIVALRNNIVALLDELEAKQAKIDSLMLEYCHDEMSPEQIEEWGKHQREARE